MFRKARKNRMQVILTKEQAKRIKEALTIEKLKQKLKR